MTFVKLPWNKTYMFQRIAKTVNSKLSRNLEFCESGEPVVVEELLLCKIKSTDETTGFYETVAACPLQYEELENLEDSNMIVSSAGRGMR